MTEPTSTLNSWQTFWQMSATSFLILIILAIAIQVVLVVAPLKYLQLRRLRNAQAQFEAVLQSAHTGADLQSLVAMHGAAPGARVLTTLVRAASERAATYEDLLGTARRAIVDEESLCQRFMPSLASIAATAPLLGLLGTVWGIIEAFLTIAAERSSELAVIAPSMSGALLTTALGLLAAMPANLAHHYLEARIGTLIDSLDTTAQSWSGRLCAGRA